MQHLHIYRYRMYVRQRKRCQGVGGIGSPPNTQDSHIQSTCSYSNSLNRQITLTEHKEWQSAITEIVERAATHL